MDPDPGKEIEVDPDPDRALKWIRIRPIAVDPDGSGSATLENNLPSLEQVELLIFSVTITAIMLLDYCLFILNSVNTIFLYLNIIFS